MGNYISDLKYCFTEYINLFLQKMLISIYNVFQIHKCHSLAPAPINT